MALNAPAAADQQRSPSDDCMNRPAQRAVSIGRWVTSSAPCIPAPPAPSCCVACSAAAQLPASCTLLLRPLSAAAHLPAAPTHTLPGRASERVHSQLLKLAYVYSLSPISGSKVIVEKWCVVLDTCAGHTATAAARQAAAHPLHAGQQREQPGTTRCAAYSVQLRRARNAEQQQQHAAATRRSSPTAAPQNHKTTPLRLEEASP